MTSRVPRYYQIAEDLRARIRDGRLLAGDRLENQRRLAREFGVTLMTLRHALELLERDGLISRRHGLGTFVAAPHIDYDILQLRTFAGDLTAQGEDVATRFLRSDFVSPDRGVARALGLRAGQRAFVLERLRLVDGHPMSFQASYLPTHLGDEVSKADLRVTPLRQVLSFKLGIEIVTARETVSAVPLDSRAARDLGCRTGIPAFRSDRVSLDAAGIPVVYDRVFIPGDRFRITRDLRYDHSPESPTAGPSGPDEVATLHGARLAQTRQGAVR